MKKVDLMNHIDICFICDDHFALPTGVAVQSLIENCDMDNYYNVYIICHKVSEINKQRFLQINANNFSIQLIDLSSVKCYEKLLIDGLHVTPAALFKFDLPNIFSELDKIIYVDGDVIIRKDLYSLYSIDIRDKYAAVVRDRRAFFYKGMNLFDRLGISCNEYFNTGMMVLNLKKMREDEIPSKLLDYRINGKNDFMDQDAFNVVCNNCVKYISLRYNSITTCIQYMDIEHINKFYPEEIFVSKEDLFDKSVIWHFASPEKPWKYTNIKHRKYWLQYFYCSTFRDVVLNCNMFDFENRSRNNKRLQDLIGKDYANIKLSIIIPVYNAEVFIGKCLDSIIQQKVFENFEVICVDDGSIDNTSLVLELYRRRDPRIRVFSQNNSYAGVARNLGMSVAHGTYITFIDADDELGSGASLKNALDLAYQNNVDIVCCNAGEMSPEGKKGSICGWNLRFQYIPKKEIFKLEELDDNAFLAFGGCSWGKVYKRSFLMKHNINFPKVKRSEDFYFVQIALMEAASISVLNDVLIYHRGETGNNLEAGKDETPLIFWDVEKMFYSYLVKNNLYNKYEKAAKICSLNRFRYNLLAMKTFEGYKKVYEYGKCEILPYLTTLEHDNKHTPPGIFLTIHIL